MDTATLSARAESSELSMLELAYFASFDRVPPRLALVEPQEMARLLHRALLLDEPLASNALKPSDANWPHVGSLRQLSGPCQVDETKCV